ncbi:MAG: hypothetical protein JWN76_2670 [Chitinophagaceae bacterium]|nr:hypothetical protein [Chitinophagaceae bacterium]
MKGFKFICSVTLILTGCFFFSSFIYQPSHTENFSFPYQKAGLTEKQAAAHLLSRFTYGARPGEVDKVVNMGLEKWFALQLDGNLPDDSLAGLLNRFDAINLSNEQVVNTYPRIAKVLRMAMQDGVIDKDSVNKADKKEYRAQLQAYMEQKGLKPVQELYRQFINQKILRAANSNNQLRELLTDFWFNHFNVSVTKNDCAEFIPAYERDVIRPNVNAHFEDLLLATAKSPAMLLYLDNFSSAGTNANMPVNPRLQKRVAAQMEQQMGAEAVAKLKNAKKAQGLNENYAREVMELHTLGVDGGYTQSDVTQAARVLTGWTVYPISDYGQGAQVKKMIERVGEDRMKQQGFVHEGDFLFAANRHDNGEKTVLGKTFPANHGYDEGVELLKMLAHHQSTAKFISKKLATRFVSDIPPQSLVDKMSATFLKTNGDIKQVLITMASSPEFWSNESLRQKTKSPFELTISAVRSLNAEINQPYQLFTWLNRMGQKMYYYQAPTGFPDRGQYWINTGSLLNRMNFGLALASGRIPGVRINLLALNKGHEPESAEQALIIYSKLILPERDLSGTIERLKPLLNDPDLEGKINAAASKATPASAQNMMTDASDPLMEDNKKPTNVKNAMVNEQKNMLAQVVGIIIGSPEFQRK